MVTMPLRMLCRMSAAWRRTCASSAWVPAPASLSLALTYALPSATTANTPSWSQMPTVKGEPSVQKASVK